MKTYSEAWLIATKWEEDDFIGPGALVARALLAHINSLASPQVTDDQMRSALAGLLEIEDARVSSGAFTPNDEAKRRIDAARALLSAPPAAETPTNLELAAYNNLPFNQETINAKRAAAPQEAKPVADDLETALTVFDMGLGFALCHRYFGDTRNAIKKLQADFTAIRSMLAAAPQEQAPADKDAIRNAALEEAAKFLQKLADDYINDHGSYDHETGFVEYPESGREYVSGLEEQAEAIRALQSQPQQVAGDQS